MPAGPLIRAGSTPAGGAEQVLPHRDFAVHLAAVRPEPLFAGRSPLSSPGRQCPKLNCSFIFGPRASGNLIQRRDAAAVRSKGPPLDVRAALVFAKRDYAELDAVP